MYFFSFYFIQSSRALSAWLVIMVYEMGYKTDVQEMAGKELIISLLLEEGPQLSELSAGIFRVASCGDLIDSPVSL